MEGSPIAVIVVICDQYEEIVRRHIGENVKRCRTDVYKRVVRAGDAT